MAPVEIRFEIGDQEIAMPELERGERRIFHFSKPMHRGLRVECTEADTANVEVWSNERLNPWTQISFVPNQFTKNHVRVDGDEKGETVAVDLGFGVKAKIKNRKYPKLHESNT